MILRLVWITGALGVVAACSSGNRAGPVDAALADVQSPADAVQLPDAGLPDGSPPDAGFVMAAHPRMPLVIQQRGFPNTAPDITAVTFAAGYTNQRSDLEALVSGLVVQPFWAATTSEYGIGAATVESPVHLDEDPPTTNDTIKAWLTAKIESGAPGFANASSSSLFVIYYPATTVVTTLAGTSCVDWDGYHTHTTATVAGQTVYPTFAIVAECSNPTAQATLDETTNAASHEIVEGVTDPYVSDLGGSPPYPAFIGTSKGAADLDPYVAWSIMALGHPGFAELADMCDVFGNSSFTPGGFPYEVQRSWSNANVRASKDPCAPYGTGEGAYFLAQPVFDPDFAANEAMDPPVYLPAVAYTDKTGSYHTQGIQIAAGASAMVPLILWSEGPVSDWTVTAYDPLAPAGQASPYLGFALDRRTGNNGDTLQLTITVKTTDTSFAGHPFAVTSSHGGINHTTFGFVASN
jgi:hypothetical protein